MKRLTFAGFLLLSVCVPAWAYDYQGLRTEIAKPAYNGLTDTQIAALINTTTITLTPSPLTLTGGQLYNAIVPAEWTALTAAMQQNIRDILYSAGAGIDVSSGTNARNMILLAFGAGTQTRANLVALVTITETLAQEFGWTAAGLTPGEITAARLLH